MSSKKPAKPLDKKAMKKIKGGNANTGGKKGTSSGGAQQEYYKIEIKDAFISS